MQKVYEKDASVTRVGNYSLYALLEEPFLEYLGVERPPEGKGSPKHDVKVAMAIGKYGPFVYFYSPSRQKRWQREQKKKEAEE